MARVTRPRTPDAGRQPDKVRRNETNSTVSGYVRVTFVVTAEDKEFVSTCPELGIASQGTNVEEAFENLKDATITYLATIEQLGERQRIFKERRIRTWPSEPAQEQMSLKLRPREFGMAFVAPIVSAKPGRKASLVRTA